MSGVSGRLEGTEEESERGMWFRERERQRLSELGSGRETVRRVKGRA